MKKISVILMVLCTLMVIQTNAQSWSWSKQAGGTDFDGINKMCIDQNSNIYIAGVFMSSDFFCGTDTLFCNSYDRFFISKYDLNGNLQWIKGFGGNNSSSTFQGINDISYDPITNSIIGAGTFYGPCIFDTITLTSNGTTDAFVAKFDLNGH